MCKRRARASARQRRRRRRRRHNGARMHALEDGAERVRGEVLGVGLHCLLETLLGTVKPASRTLDAAQPQQTCSTKSTQSSNQCIANRSRAIGSHSQSVYLGNCPRILLYRVLAVAVSASCFSDSRPRLYVVVTCTQRQSACVEADSQRLSAPTPLQATWERPPWRPCCPLRHPWPWPRPWRGPRTRRPVRACRRRAPPWRGPACGTPRPGCSTARAGTPAQRPPAP